jgi:hypothetical protein
MFTPRISLVSLAVFALGSAACVAKSDPPGAPSSSEVAVSVISGALNNGSGSALASLAPAPRKGALARALDFVNPVGTAYAADWSCTGQTLAPAFAGAGTYMFTPPSCTIDWGGGLRATSTWSGAFTLAYGASCDGTSALMDTQPAGCTLTRTAPGGDTRTITGPDGNSYAILHDTNGAGTGYDPSITVSDGGVVDTCGAAGCDADRTIVVNGSHLTGTVDYRGESFKIWDHTVSTTGGGVTVTGSGASRVASGSVVVQHNILRETATTTFASVGYGEPGCCFPTTGSVTTTFTNGPDAGKTESIAFSADCGEGTLTTASGKTEAITLMHCL